MADKSKRNNADTSKKGKNERGFAGMGKDKQRETSRKGGKSRGE